MFGRTRVGLAAAAASLALVASGTASATAMPAWRTTPTVHLQSSAVMPKIVGLRYAEHVRFDRVVIDVQGRRPGYAIRYTPRLTYDPSGRAVPLRGRQKMSLVLRPAAAHSASGANLYQGPRLRQVGLPTLKGIALTGDFEGVVSFGFTTSRKAPYRIFTLTHPNRIVVDWHH
jgi:hypothetical protein